MQAEIESSCVNERSRGPASRINETDRNRFSEKAAAGMPRQQVVGEIRVRRVPSYFYGQRRARLKS